MNLYAKAKIKKESNNGKRFYSRLDMAIIKHDEAVRNSEVKRGELKITNNRYIYICGCGVEGCFIHGSR